MCTMKDSGIEWIGEEPDQWKNAKLGTSVYMKGRIGWQGLRFDDFIDEGPYLVTGTDFDGGKIIWSRCYHISEIKYSEDPAIHLRSQDVLFTKDGTVGKVAFVDKLPGPASLNSHLLLLRPKTEDLNSSFLFWVLQSSVFERYKNLVQHGSIMDSISQTDMSHFIVPLPPREEQEAIARYLDAKIGLNDRLADVVEKQISDLEHYRASVIHEAVTRGLDPDVTAKPSGVDWIGDIPANWSVKRLKYLFDTSSGSTPDSSDWSLYDGDINWIQSGDLYGVSSVVETARKITVKALRESAALKVYESPFVVMAMYGASVGNVAVSKIDACTNQACCVMLPREGMTPRYLFYVLLDSQMPLKQKALGGTQPNISQVIIRNHKIPVPPISVQDEIADYLDACTAIIDAVLDTKRKQLDILKRRRQSLIYEYVTGKRRVAEEA